jgi:hypothetical protein
VVFEHGPLGFALDGPDRRTLSTVFKPGHSRAAVQGSVNERAVSQLRVGWTLAQVNGKRVRPERDLVMAQIKFAPRPLTLTWRTNGIEPPTRAADGQPPGQQTPQGRSAQRRRSPAESAQDSERLLGRQPCPGVAGASAAAVGGRVRRSGPNAAQVAERSGHAGLSEWASSMLTRMLTREFSTLQWGSLEPLSCFERPRSIPR